MEAKRRRDGRSRGGARRAADPILPSRRAALAVLRRSIAEGRAPVLLTGEPGSGKTWLTRRLIAADRSGRRWLAIDVAPATETADLLRAIAGRLGLEADACDSAGRLRLRVEAALRESSTDGHRLALVVDECHLATDELLEGLRVASNDLGRPSGFDALVLVGQTPLIGRLTTQALRGLDARLATRAHLGPLDADEAEAWLRQRRPDVLWTAALAERLHRDARGNAVCLRRLADDLSEPLRPAGRASRAIRNGVMPRTCPPEPSPVDVAAPVGAPIPARPPLRVEEGLIEVGWDTEPAPEADTPLGPATWTAHRPASEPIGDRYSALQARLERERNGVPDLDDEWPVPENAEGVDDPSAPGASRQASSVRADAGQRHAPYGDLFQATSPHSGDEP
jgi:type II secretory pathway predicted ATPase ExeA